MPPALPQAWTGVRDATKLGPSAPQLQLEGQVTPPWLAFCFDPPGTPTSEDCLVLNVWTPKADASKRPVLVWLHGGGYTVGSASPPSYDGANLARAHDVVVVSINHRLNALGFTNLGPIAGEQFSKAGNVGLLDIVAALEWVKQNIHVFGGDASRVMIFGESGGGGKVSHLLAMPAAKGLFHRAVIESGASIRSGTQEAAGRTAQMLLQELGLTAANAAKLQDLPVEQIMDAARRVAVQGGGRGFGPLVDGSVLPRNPFDPDAPEISADVPLIVGYNHTESTLFQIQDQDAFKLNDAGLAARVKKMAGDNAAKILSAYKAAYPSATPSDLYFIMSTDASMAASSNLLAERKAAAKHAPAYLYRFDWQTPVDGGMMRAPHTIEIPFVFNNMTLPIVQKSFGTDSHNAALAEKVSGVWAAFARTGVPEHQGLPKWKPYDVPNRATMLFSNDSKVVNDPAGDARRLLQASTGPDRRP